MSKMLTKLGGISDKGIRRIAQMSNPQKKVEIRIDERDMGDLDGLNIQESMHNFCDQVADMLSAMWEDVSFDVEWGENRVDSEGWTQVNYAEELEVLDSIDAVQNEVYERQEWFVEK